MRLDEKDRWVQAQRIHAKEHALGLPTSLSCEAVGHMPMIDEYIELFGADQRRKFLTAIGESW